MVDIELESFKTNIDLRAYAAGQGYQLDHKKAGVAPPSCGIPRATS